MFYRLLVQGCVNIFPLHNHIVVDSWNLFPPDIVDISSLQAFILIIVSQFQEHFISEKVLATHAVISVLKI